MSLSTSKTLTILRPEALSAWLVPRIAPSDFASWGVKTGTKNVHNLWMELLEGESVLENSSTHPCRTVNCCAVRVRGTGGKVLLESYQALSDGSLRARGRPLSEKMKSGERAEAAAFRVVQEELGSILSIGIGAGCNVSDVMRLVPGSYGMSVKEREFSSNPGLRSRYLVHQVDAYVDGLPDREFCTVEEEYGDCADTPADLVTVKKHFWVWGLPPPGDSN